MHCVSAKFVPRLLTDDLRISSKEQMMAEMFWKMSLLVNGMGLKPNNIPHTGRVLLRLTPRKHESMTWEWKQCCLFFWSSRDCALWIHSWRSDNEDFYLAVLRCLQDAAWRKWPKMWAVPTHTAMSVCQLDNSWQNVQVLPFCNPLFTWPLPSRFFYFLNWKLPLKKKISDSGGYHH
jgi:hypothetical protein